MLFVILFIVIGVGIGTAFFILNIVSTRRHFGKLFELRLLSIELPRQTQEKEKTDLVKEINQTSQLLSLLANLKIPFAFEVAVQNIGEDIIFYLAVPESVIPFATNQIHGLWREANVKAADEFTIFHPEGGFAGAYLKQKHSSILPIRTFEEVNLDTFAAIVSNFSNLELVGEGMALQILVKPVSNEIKNKITKAIYQLKKGKKLEAVLKEPFIGSAEGMEKLGEIFRAISPPAKKPEAMKDPIIVDEEAVKILNQKIGKPLFDVNVRLVTSAISQFQADNLLENLAGSFRQFGAPLHNEFKVVKPRNLKNFIFKFTMRDFETRESMLLNAHEISSLFHLPLSTTDIPKVKWLKTREAAPPTTLAPAGVLIGESVFRNEQKPIYVSEDDRRRHLYIIGQTGTGKSTLLTNMVAHDIKNDKGLAIIDPHGDLIETILSLIPQNRYEDVIVFDPGDRERPLGMNMLEYDLNKPEEKTFIVNELFSILDKLYDMKTVGGPMFEQYTKNAILLLMEDAVNDPGTLMEMPRIFTDPEYRKLKLSRIANPVVIDFWEKEAIKATGEHSLQNMAPYITSKFNNFIGNDYMRPIIGQTHSAFNFRNIMDRGKILLINLSKGKIGDINANLLGMVITGKILMAALSRVDIPNPEERRDFNLYIDEFQNFTTDSISTILSEARKYRLNLTMAHQFIGQLTEKIRNAVFGNVGSMVAFRVGAEDAEFLEKQFAPVFNKNDLINIDNFNAYVKILIKGQTTQPFNIKTAPAVRGSLENIVRIKDFSGLKYGRERREVELEIYERLKH